MEGHSDNTSGSHHSHQNRNQHHQHPKENNNASTSTSNSNTASHSTTTKDLIKKRFGRAVSTSSTASTSSSTNGSSSSTASTANSATQAPIPNVPVSMLPNYPLQKIPEINVNEKGELLYESIPLSDGSYHENSDGINSSDNLEYDVTIGSGDNNSTSSLGHSNNTNLPQTPTSKTPPKTLGSYRNRAGKFSNTLSNLLPNISAKLHHSKKGSNKTNAGESLNSKSNANNKNNNDTTGSGGTSSNTNYNVSNLMNKVSNIRSTSNSSTPYLDSPSSKDRFSMDSTLPSSANGIESSSNSHLLGSVTPPELPLHPSTSASMQLAIPFPRSSLDSLSFAYDQPQGAGVLPGASSITGAASIMGTRTRNNTINSQITSISGNYASNIWADNPQPFPQTLSSGISTSHNSGTKHTIKNNTANTGAQDSYFAFDYGNPAMNTTNTNMNKSQTSHLQASSNSWRARSKSNASSMYMDAAGQYYDQASTNEHPPTYITTKATAAQDGGFYQNSSAGPYSTVIPPVVGDDIDPKSLNWVTTDVTAPPINHVANIPPTNTITISNIFSLQKQQTETLLSNAINLTSSSVATLCLSFGPVVSARTLSGLNLALVEFQTIDSAVRAKELLNNREISMLGIPSIVSFAKIIPVNVRSNSITPSLQSIKAANDSQMLQPRSLLQEQLLNGSLSFQQNGNISIPMFTKGYEQSIDSNVSSNYLPIPSANYVNNSSHSNLNFLAANKTHGYSFSSVSNNNHNSNSSTNNHSNSNGYNTGHGSNSIMEKEECPFKLPPPELSHKIDELHEVINKFIENETSYNKNEIIDETQIQLLIKKSLNYKGTKKTNDFGPLPEPLQSKVFDSPTLRELRKMLDSHSLSDLETEQLALCMLDELPELCSDYLGNTIVQKLFQNSSEIVKDIMLRKTNKYLTSMGVHKNGTWACQKMITMSTEHPSNKNLVVAGIQDFCAPLFNDQFGNYVIQCCLKFGFPWNSFIFESIIANFWTICQSRYGARAVRACLEATDIITKEQLIVLSAMIVIYSEYLSTNTNGTLLLTWYLDTCPLPHKQEILTPRLIDHVVELSCHKLASLTILKVLNHRNEFKAKRQIVETIFGGSPDFSKNKNYSSKSKESNVQDVDTKDLQKNDELSAKSHQKNTPPLKKHSSDDVTGDIKSVTENNNEYSTLISILSDTNYGPTFIYKVLSLSLLDSQVREYAIQQVKSLLMNSDPSLGKMVVNAKAHRKLMEEIGLGSTNLSSSNNTSPSAHQVNVHSQRHNSTDMLLMVPTTSSQQDVNGTYSASATGKSNATKQPSLHPKVPSLSHIFGNSSSNGTNGDPSVLSEQQQPQHLAAGQHLRNLSVGSVLSTKSTRSRGFSTGASNFNTNASGATMMPGGFYSFASASGTSNGHYSHPSTSSVASPPAQIPEMGGILQTSALSSTQTISSNDKNSSSQAGNNQNSNSVGSNYYNGYGSYMS
ncbi:hypothetical protein ACO0QE_004172 [Hanseniaspora vineae]